MLSFRTYPVTLETVETIKIGVLRRQMKRPAGPWICSLTAHSTLKCGQKAAKNAFRVASKVNKNQVGHKKQVCPWRDSNPQPFP